MSISLIYLFFSNVLTLIVGVSLYRIENKYLELVIGVWMIIVLGVGILINSMEV